MSKSRHLVPSTLIQGSTGQALVWAAPLFEEERNSISVAAVANVPYPICIDRSGSGSRFATHDNPVDARQRKARHRAQERLDRQEFGLRCCLAQRTNAMYDLSVLNASSHPNVLRPLESLIKFQHAFGTFRENLKGVLRAAMHHVEDTSNKIEGYIVVKKVTH